MSTTPLRVIRTGLVTSVGLSAPAACAAIRSKLANPTETRFMDSAGAWIMSHAVPLEQPLRGIGRVAHMAAMVIDECMIDMPREQWERVPMLMCIAEQKRPGRLVNLDQQLFDEVCRLLGNARFPDESRMIPHGRVGVAVALLHARRLLDSPDVPAVLIVAADTLLTGPTLRVYEQQGRLLTKRNSNGLIPGEGASALLVSRPTRGPHLSITGLGFATEHSTIERDEPLRAQGLALAIRHALAEAACGMHEIDFRITDISGEQYYFKEAALALSRTLARPKEELDIWHPAECIGETGSAIGPAMIAVAEASGRKAYAPGPSMLVHASNDSGERAAIVTRYGVN